jgi:hypothetical protein
MVPPHSKEEQGGSVVPGGARRAGVLPWRSWLVFPRSARPAFAVPGSGTERTAGHIGKSTAGEDGAPEGDESEDHGNGCNVGGNRA